MGLGVIRLGESWSSSTASAGLVVLSAGLVVLPAGLVVLPAGLVVLSAGLVVLGLVVLSAGLVVLGLVVLSAGLVVLSAGSVVLGLVVLSAGLVVLGLVVLSAGLVVLAVGGREAGMASGPVSPSFRVFWLAKLAKGWAGEEQGLSRPASVVWNTCVSKWYGWVSKSSSATRIEHGFFVGAEVEVARAGGRSARSADLSVGAMLPSSSEIAIGPVGMMRGPIKLS